MSAENLAEYLDAIMMKLWKQMVDVKDVFQALKFLRIKDSAKKFNKFERYQFQHQLQLLFALLISIKIVMVNVRYANHITKSIWLELDVILSLAQEDKEFWLVDNVLPAILAHVSVVMVEYVFGKHAQQELFY